MPSFRKANPAPHAGQQREPTFQTHSFSHSAAVPHAGRDSKKISNPQLTVTAEPSPPPGTFHHESREITSPDARRRIHTQIGRRL
jgi:hypothetical protein